MIVYHWTRKKNLNSILKSGINPPSYWGSLQTALSFSFSSEDSIILSTETDNYNFSVNMDNAIIQKKNNCIEELPDLYDLESGINFFEGVVCHESICTFNIIDPKDFITY